MSLARRHSRTIRIGEDDYRWTPDGSTRDVFVLRDLAAHISVEGRAGKCAQCGRLLTAALRPLTPPSVLDCNDGHDMVPSSHYMTSDGDFFPEGWAVARLTDAVDAVDRVTLARSPTPSIG